MTCLSSIEPFCTACMHRAKYTPFCSALCLITPGTACNGQLAWELPPGGVWSLRKSLGDLYWLLDIQQCVARVAASQPRTANSVQAPQSSCSNSKTIWDTGLKFDWTSHRDIFYQLLQVLSPHVERRWSIHHLSAEVADRRWWFPENYLKARLADTALTCTAAA